MKKILQDNEAVKKSSLPYVSLLLTIAMLAITCAAIVYRYASDRSHHKKWQDYDDCGLA